ncbi:MAG: hypothetical protein JXQ76_01855 [Campylobacterales bacterium]|nr:hypothetical protein [Campylobacterales bacterium]
MYAVEFETVVDSPYIKLENHQDFIHQKIKVIILADEKKMHPPIDTTAFFDRLRSRDIPIDKTIDIDELMNNNLQQVF